MLDRLMKRRLPPDPAIPPDRRVYAIGDVHGRLDLLEALLEIIREDHAGRAVTAGAAEVVLLGDLIDRGPDSAGVVDRVMRSPEWARFIVLRGNHEDAMLKALDGDRAMMKTWLRNGGDAALRSWGMTPSELRGGSFDEVLEAAEAYVPAAHRAFIARGRQSIQIGDYYFVHAGVRPGVRLAEQCADDQLWIRQEFLGSDAHHGAMIVHGHSISASAELLPNRIGLDTGAYASGRLTALGLEGTDRWILTT